ncbi:caspase-1-like [Sitodiplosis mosellana]|uniref:caspase-1-like n=1 Tax=Sitodiplosis mosellana TaxID=263140 RepID=UPI0024443313|nr:caspase-1-like [Sitodiplosis mosellana]
MGNSLTKCCDKESAPDKKKLEETEVAYTPSDGTPNGYPKKSITIKEAEESKIDVVDSTSIDPLPMPQFDTPDTIEAKWDDQFSPNHYYKMNHKKRGLALIFNHEVFDCNTPRKGTRADRDNLHKTLEALDFDVEIFENESISDIKGILEEIAAKDHSDSDCLMIVVLTHGDQVPLVGSRNFRGQLLSTILAHDLVSYLHASDNKYPLQKIWEHFTDDKCPSLANKPKIFLIQACQGKATDEGYGVSTQNYSSIYRRRAPGQDSNPFSTTKYKTFESVQLDKKKRPQKDYLIVYSTMPGHVSYRDTENGTWFIESLCKVLNEKKHELDLFQMLTLVNQKVAVDYQSEDAYKQMPCIVSMLTKLIMFPKKKPLTNGF